MMDEMRESVATDETRRRMFRVAQVLTVIFLVAGIVLFAAGMVAAEQASTMAETSLLTGVDPPADDGQVQRIAGGVLAVLGAIGLGAVFVLDQPRNRKDGW